MIRKRLKRMSCIALCMSMVATGGLLLPLQDAYAAEETQNDGQAITSENLFLNSELNPDLTKNNKPHWWYANGQHTVMSIAGVDKDGNNQYVKVSDRTHYYDGISQNITNVIKERGDKVSYELSAWFKVAADATVNNMDLKAGLNVTYKDGSVSYDAWSIGKDRVITANKESWVQVKTSFQADLSREISAAEIVFSASKQNDISSFYIDGVMLTLKNKVETPTVAPTETPAVEPTIVPTEAPTIAPTQVPTTAPVVKTKKKNPLKVKKVSYTKTKDTKEFKLIGITGKGAITYKSSNRSIITVDKNGYVTIKGYGKATIKVTAAGNKQYSKATKKITVKVVPNKLTLKAQSNKKKQVKVKWRKNKVATGYQVKIASDKKFRFSRTYELSSKRSSYTIKNLSRKATYYIKVRVSKKVGENTVYSSWSTVKKVVIK